MKNLKYRNGDSMPILGLGTWKSAPGDVYKAVKEAIKIGYRHIDCAFVYGNEKEVGQAIKESIEEQIVTREDLWITSKLWNSEHGFDNVLPALKNTLADLQLDYLDLYLIHWPVSLKIKSGLPQKPEDFANHPIADTWKGMETAFDEGFVRHIGVSNFSIVKLQKLMQSARIKPEMNQVEINPYMQQDTLVDFCKANDILVTAYAPLGSSDRPEFLKSNNEPVLLEDEKLKIIANDNGISVAQVLLAWTIKRGISVIPKSVNPERLKQNLAAAEVKLTADYMAQIKVINRDRRYCDGRLWCIEEGPFTYATLWDE